MVDTGSYFSPLGEGIILALIQVGGLGYMTATTFLLLLLGRRLGLRERLAIQQSMDKAELAGGRSLVISIITMTLLFEADRYALSVSHLQPGLRPWLRALAVGVPQHQRF